ncbi:YadA-like family protein [Campylobacter portucalensis]|uniref:YadA-like family protein n=1 Tax=Campylobacter portucalensis TaxID=2608384 RepID=UPI0018A6B0DB|nr:YadA-like family protein [Campylobacter portucalensis]
MNKKAAENHNREGVAIGYKAFAQGNEATSIGNDTVAWGNSSIAIGTDNVSGDESLRKALSRDVFRLFYNARSNFNDTGSYAATKFNKAGHIENGKKQTVMADADGILYSKDFDDYNSQDKGEALSKKDGKIYIRKKGNDGNPSYNAGYYVYHQGIFYEAQGDILKEINKDYKSTNNKNYKQTIEEIQKLPDWQRYQNHKKEVDEAYQEYLKDNRRFKTHTWAKGNNAIALGARSIAYGDYSTALGTLAIANRDYSTALGTNTIAFGTKSLAVGNEAYVYEDESVGIGNNVQALYTGSMVYGRNAYAGGKGSLAIGSNVFSNVIMKEDEIKQLEKIYEGNSTDITLNKFLESNVQSNYVAKLEDQYSSGEKKAQRDQDSEGRFNNGSIAIGSYSIANGDNSLAIGRFAYAKNDKAFAIGQAAYAKNSKSFAIGYGAKSLNNDSIAFGSLSRVEAPSSLALGIDTKVLKEMPVELMTEENKKKNKDSNFTIPVENAMAIGNNAKAYYLNSIALGVNAKTDYTQTEMAQDAWAPKYAISLPSSEKIGYLSVGGKNAERRIVNVAPGYSDTDAVNVSQLKALEEAILYGNTLDDDSDINHGVKYLSVKGLDELKNLVTKKHDYENYTKIKKDYLKLKLRKVINQEDINLTKMEAKLEKYDKKYTDFKKTASKLKELDEQMSQQGYGPTYPNNYDAEQKEKLKKDWYNQLFVDIENAEKIDKSDENINKLITEDDQEKLKNSNFFSDGAKKSGSIAIGVGALANSSESIVIGKNAKIENDAAQNTVLLGNNTSSATANAVALGNYSVADRTPEPASKLSAQQKSNTYITDELAKLIDDHHMYAAVSVGRYGGDLEDLKNSTDAKAKENQKKYEKWVKENAVLKETKPDEYEKQRLEEAAKVKKFALRKIVNVAPGTKDTDVVILAQLKEGVKQARGHYVSVNGTSQEDNSNYNNDGATKRGAIAIGEGAQSKAQNAVVIGKNVSLDVPNSFVLGSDNTVTQNDRGLNHAVVVMGSGTTLRNSRASIAIGAVKANNGNHIKDGTRIEGTLIENSEWSTVIGNKATIYNATDSLALGNNIKVYANKTEVDKKNRIANNKNKKNSNLIIIGNGAKAAQAGDSVVIGAGAVALNGDEAKHEYKEVKNSVAIGKGATTKVSGAVAIGSGSKVEEAAGDSIAIGKESEATAKETANKEATVIVGKQNIKFNWSGGVSSNNNDNNKKTVFSVGRNGVERKIKNVAAGDVTKNSTDAVNGSQLYAVADEFSKLAIDVLGAKAENANNKFGFKKSNFEVVKYNGNTNPQSPKEMTFKNAIDENIKAINKGIVIGDADNNRTHYLGDTLTIKAGNIDKQTSDKLGYSSNNIKVKYQPNSGEFLIGIKDDPTFKKVELEEKQEYEKNDKVKENELITKRYLKGALSNVASSFSVKGDKPSEGESQSLEINSTNKTLNINGGSNITTTVDRQNQKITVGLNKDLKDINSITLKNSNDNNKTVKITVDDLGNVSVNHGDKNVSKIATATDIDKLSKYTLTFTADNNSAEFKRANDSNKTVKISGGSNITVSLKHSENNNTGTFTISANQTDTIDANAGTRINKDNEEKHPDRLTTEKAVVDYVKSQISEGTKTLEDDFLRVTGENINGHKKEFGSNIGIEKIELNEDETEGTSELIQAKALVGYLKGTGDKSVKLSDSAKTQAIGEGSISIGHNAISKNEGSIAIGYNSEASNSGAISIGQDSTVLGTSSVAVGKENNVKGNFSFVLGEGNTLDKEQTYVIGSDNEISGAKNIAIGLGNTVGGNENIVLGSQVDLKDDVESAIVLGDKSIGVSNAVSVGNASTKRRIVFVDTPQGKYDAVNKKYVDDLKIVYKANGSKDNIQTVKLMDGLDFKKDENDNIQVVVDKNGSIQHSLANNLKNIDSIKSSKDDTGAKISFASNSQDTNATKDKIEFTIGTKTANQTQGQDGITVTSTTFSFSEKGLDLGSKKIVNLADGNITNSSKEAVTGKQLLDLATKLGINVNDNNKTEFKELTFNTLALKEVNGSNETVPASIINSLEKVVSKLNSGLSYKADVNTSNKAMNNYKPQYLGSKLDIVKATSDIKVGNNGTEETYVGNNLITKYTNTNGNGKFEIGLKEKPDFKEISIKDNNKTYAVLGGNNTNGGSLILKNKDGSNESISIKAGEKPTIAFKTNNEANQTKGIGVITGLADITEYSTGDTAVNKKYVDDKLESKSAKLQVAGNVGKSFEVFDGNNTLLTIKGKELMVKYSLDETKNKSQKKTKHQNITATTQPDDKTLELSLNEHLKDMKSITGGEIGAGNGKKIASSIEFNKKGVNGTKANTNVVIKSNGADFVFDRTGLTLSGKQIKGITSGLGINSISEASKKTNLQTIANVLSGNPDSNNSNNKIAQNAVNVQDLSTIAKAIIDKGLTFKGTELTKPQGGQQTQQQATFSLGSIIEIDSSESKNGKSKDSSGSELDKKDKDIKVSIASNNNTNKITLSLNKSEALSLEDERVITSKAVKTAIDAMQNEINDKISKTDANNPFKTTYKDENGKELEKHGDKFYKKEDIPDGVKYDKNKQKFVKTDGNETDKQPTALNEDEAEKVQEIINLKGNPKKIANVDSGLGLKKYKELNPQDSDEEAKKKYKQSKKDAIDKLLGNNANEDNIKDSDPMLNNVATIRDLQALGQAGMDFMGNNETKKVHRNLGQKLAIKGDQNTTQSKFESAKDNINVAVESEALVVQLSKNLKNLTSAEFKAEDITSPKTKTTINSTGTTIVGLGDNEKENGKKAKYTLNGTKVTDNTNTFETNATGISLKQKTNSSNEEEVFAITNNSGKVTIDFKQKKDGNFTGKITGLADIDKNSTGDTAVNKKYVDTKFGELDSKLTSTNSNRPFDYYLDDVKVIKGEDGKFYKKGGTKVLSDEEAKKVIIKAEPTSKPMNISNVASGLGISEILESEKQLLNDAINEKKEALKKQDEAVQNAKDQVGKEQQTLMTAKNELSKMATERPSLLMKKAEIEQQIKTLDENDPQKATMQSALDDIEKELKQNDQKMTEATKVVSEASDALDKAKIALADNVLKAHEAQQALTTAQEILRNKENGVDKIQALVSDESDIKEANVVTVKDLKAVAKAGLNFEGNDAKRVHKNLSETLAIKGEEDTSSIKFNSDTTATGNIKVEMSKDGKGLDIKLSDKLKNMASFETKEINGTKSVLNSNGLQATSKDNETIVTAKGTEIKSKDGKSAKYNIDGIELKGKNGEPSLMATNSGLIISGNNGNIILDGTKGQILIPDIDNPKNYAQVVNKNYVDSRVGAVVNHLDNVNKNLQAGIAGANAAATLPMSSIPGRSVMAISAGTYKGKSAVALGFSSVSDNGKVLFKIQGNSNSVGDFAGGIGVGWTW